MERPVMAEPFLTSQVAREQAKDLAAGKRRPVRKSREENGYLRLFWIESISRVRRSKGNLSLGGITHSSFHHKDGCSMKAGSSSSWE